MWERRKKNVEKLYRQEEKKGEREEKISYNTPFLFPYWNPVYVHWISVGNYETTGNKSAKISLL